MKSPTGRLILFALLALGCALGASACEICSGIGGNYSRCFPVSPSEVGATRCVQQVEYFPVVNLYCFEEGTFCSSIDVGGGGGGAGGGGGGSACSRRPGGGCPAECFSCGTQRI